jgi:hypothetical protein
VPTATCNRESEHMPCGGKIVKMAGTYNGESFAQSPNYADQNHDDFWGHEQSPFTAR